MQLRFLLDKVTVDLVESIPDMSNVAYTDEFTRLNANEFHLHIAGTADFYAKNGKYVQIAPIGTTDQASIELYLNGSVLGALLHQQGQLPIHGSSFHYKGQTVLLSGASGAGKSTLTAAFCKRGGTFLTDDITPITEIDGHQCIFPISDSMKLWEDSIKRLNLDTAVISPVQNTEDKFFVNISDQPSNPAPLSCFIVLEYDNKKELSTSEVTGAEKFHLLLNQIYRKEYLQGMPALREHYFDQLVKICAQTPFYLVSRPEKLDHALFTDAIEMLITNLRSNA